MLHRGREACALRANSSSCAALGRYGALCGGKEQRHVCRRRRGAAEEHALGVVMTTREALRTSNPRANVETTAEIIVVVPQPTRSQLVEMYPLSIKFFNIILFISKK